MDNDIAALTKLLTLTVAAEAQALKEGVDVPLPNTGLQIHDGESWTPATREVWRSFTGQRSVWGVPWHGPIYAMGSKDDAVPWTGPRACGCSTCQEHVEHESKKN